MVSTFRSHLELARDDGANAIAPASSVRPARIRLFLRRSSVLTVGVTYRAGQMTSP